MIIRECNPVSISIFPYEADPPLVVDVYAASSLLPALERLRSVAGLNAEINELRRRIQLFPGEGGQVQDASSASTLGRLL